MRQFQRFLILCLCLAIPGVSSRAFSQDAGEEKADVTELLERLERIEQESRDTSGRSTGARTDRLAVLFEQSHLATAPLRPEPTRYFLARVVLINLSDEPLTLPTDDLVLVADGKEFRLSGLHDQLRTNAVYTGRASLQFESVAPPDELTVPSAGTAAVWLMYSGLPAAPNVPRMTFKVPTGDQVQEIDVNEYQRGILGLREERLGPDGCLSLITVTGELNAINAASFADELDRLGNQGVARVVVTWSETTVPLSNSLAQWLLSSSTNPRNVRNQELPIFPAAIRELHFVRLPESQSRQFAVNGVTIHSDEAAAVLAALRTACEAIPRDELRRQVVSGSPLTRAAALTHGGPRLTSEDLPLVLRSMHDPEEMVRRGAIAALAYFSEPEAIAALMSAVHGRSKEFSQAALESLASSRFPAAHARLLQYLADAPRESRAGTIAVLSRFPRPEWAGMLLDFTSDRDPQLRLAALRALVSVGHADLQHVLEGALRDEDQDIRNFAFARLADASRPGGEDAAMEFALKVLEDQPPDATVNQLLSRTRDPRAIPLLIEHLDQPGNHREEVIHLLGRVAGRRAIGMLIDRYDEFNQSEQERVLGVLMELNAAEARGLAIAAIKARQQHLMPQATRILAGNADAEAVEVLAEVLRSNDQPSWSWACNALKAIGTRDARRVLLEARGSDSAARRSEAAAALQRLDRESPAYYVTEQGILRMQEEKYDEADRMLTLAIQFDAEHARAWSHRGFVRLRLDQVAEADRDFERAATLDPFSSQAITGMAITRTLQGEYLEGIGIIQENEAKFPDDPYYAYNSACVYGRALEQVQEEEPTQDRETRLQDYQTEALLLLSKSIRLNLHDLELMRTDPDLDSLRSLDEFKALLQQLEQSAEADTDGTDSEIKE